MAGTEPLNEDGSPPHPKARTVKLELVKMIQIKKNYPDLHHMQRGVKSATQISPLLNWYKVKANKLKDTTDLRQKIFKKDLSPMMVS